jgi:hypothetical protein
MTGGSASVAAGAAVSCPSSGGDSIAIASVGMPSTKAITIAPEIFRFLLI